jgi:hypothetical protein
VDLVQRVQNKKAMKKVAYFIVLFLHFAGVVIGFFGLVLGLISRIVMLKFRRVKPLWDEYLKDSKYIL